MVEVRRLSGFTVALDSLMRPLMFALGGFNKDSVQETHFWHNQPIDRSAINESLAVIINGDDERALVKSNRVFPLPVFHMPILGGWRNYAVLQVESTAPFWHVGWIHLACPPGSRPLATLQRLAITDRQVRVLTQSVGFVTEYFAIGPSGDQLPVRVVSYGVLGDMKYPAIRLM